ncbi:MAG TPA: branched-chain amino acid ABC transporter substrate-binding protein [Dehalococcoidia bacterium]|nr:branched-chain amino acid ABC transporter substrate-binding protein [Dehalococcoidia bacterium]
MSNRAHRILGLAGLFALVLPLAACASGPSAEAYLYVAVPLTGDMAARGQEIAGGVRLRADEVNREGGILGKRVVVRPLDDGGDGDGAVSAAKVVAEAVRKGETILGVVGHYNSGATGPALDNVYKDLDVAVITPGSSNTTLTQKGYSRFFRVVSTDDIQGPVDARKALSLGWKRIALLHTDNLYARGLASAFAGELRQRGAQPIIDLEMKYNNLSVFLRDLPGNVDKTLGLNPDGIFFAGDYPEGIPLLDALRTAGYRGGFMTGDSVMEYEFIDSLGSKAEGAIISNIQPEMAAVASEPWKNSYRALERRSPGMDSITGHAAAEVLLEGIKRANTARGSAVADALRKLELKTMIGDWASDAHGDMRVRKIYLFQVRNGLFEQIGEER